MDASERSALLQAEAFACAMISHAARLPPHRLAGSGKSWVCRQLGQRFRYVQHDRCWSYPTTPPPEGSTDPQWGPRGSVSTHLAELKQAAHGERPVITEVPFGERQLREQLEAAGVARFRCSWSRISATITARYLRREGCPPSDGVLTRAKNLEARAREWRAFAGSSSEVLAHLKRHDRD